MKKGQEESGTLRGERKVAESLSGALPPHASPQSAAPNGSLSDCPVEYADPEKLTPHPLNWTQHPESQRLAISESIREHGWLVPLVVNRRSGYTLDGHGRRDIALELGLSQVPVRYVDEDEEGEKRILARLNRTAALAETHDEALAALLSDLAESERGFPAGWEQEDLDKLLKAASEPVPPEEFNEYDEEIETEFCCPRCGYEWAGKPA